MHTHKPIQPPKSIKKVREHTSEMKLAMHPIQAPSPFCKSHRFLSKQIIIWKRINNTSKGGTTCTGGTSINTNTKDLTFGVELRYVVKGALVEVANANANANANARGIANGNDVNATNNLQQDLDTRKPVHVPVVADADADAGTCTDMDMTRTTPTLAVQPEEKLKLKPKPNPKQVSIVIPKVKRRRVQFGTMTATSVLGQHQRTRPGGCHVHVQSQQSMLQNGDIILCVNGKSIGGIMFHDATKLFANNNCRETKLLDGSIVLECVLVVARETKVIKALEKMEALLQRKAAIAAAGTVTMPNPMTWNISSMAVVPSEMPKIPLVTNEAKDAILSGDLSTVEFQTMVKGLQEVVMNGGKIDDSTFEKMVTDPKCQSIFIQRNENDLRRKWMVETKTMERKLVVHAVAKWKQEWEAEVESSRTSTGIDPDGWNVTYLSPLERSKLRSLARPSRGCKCGKLDHSYVNDPKCVLYRNVKGQVDPRQLKDLEIVNVKESKKLLEKYEGKLNSIGNAHVQRLVKQSEQQKAEELEARFVDEMESLQTSKLQMAIFAPNDLSVMILSAIASCAGVVKVAKNDSPDNATTRSRIKDDMKVCGDDDSDSSDDDDDDDDIPLMALCKRRSSPFPSPQKKSASVKVPLIMPNVDFMAKICSLMSKTWGHVYFQSSRVDNSW